MESDFAADKPRIEALERLEVQNLHLQAQVLRYQSSVSPSAQRSYILRKDLLALLGASDMSRRDLDWTFKIKQRLSAADKARSEQLLCSPLFGDWLTLPISRELLVHGDFVGTQYVSRLSYFCANLVHAMQNMSFRHAIFFCGRHLNHSDVGSGGRAMIRSLIGPPPVDYRQQPPSR